MNRAEVKRRQAEVFSAVISFITVMVVAGMTGQNGVAYTGAALEVFWFLWILLGRNVSDVLGRLIRSRYSKGQYKNASEMRRNVMLLQLFLGVAGGILLLAAAESIFRQLFRIPYSTMILMVLAPAFLLRMLSSVLLGFFQGEGQELPTAVSLILRQVFILVFGLMFGNMLEKYGEKVSRLLLQDNFTSMYSGTGIAIAIDLTEGFILLFLLFVYKAARHPEGRREDGMRSTDSAFDCLRAFVSGRGAGILVQLLAFLPLPVGLLFLQKSVEDTQEILLSYGTYLSGYAAVCGILVCVVIFLLLPVVGRIWDHIKKEEQRYTRNVFQGGTHLSLVHGMFLAVMLTVLASSVGAMSGGESAEEAGAMFAGGAVAVLFLPAAYYFGKVLMLTGRRANTLAALAVSDVVYVVAITIFLNAGQMGVSALVFGGLIWAGVLCVLLGFFAYKQLRCRFDWLRFLILPAGAAAVSGLLALLLEKLLSPHMSSPVTVIVCLLPGAIVYWGLVLLLRSFREQELELLPGSRGILAAGQMLRVF